MLRLIPFTIIFFVTNAYAIDRAPTSAELKAISMQVADRLKDPDSAKLTDVRVSSGEFRYVCGMVNAKNSYGGYTGKKPFMGMLDGKGSKQIFAVIGIGVTETEAAILLKRCSEKLNS